MAETGLVHIIDDDEAVRSALGSLVRSVGNEARLYGSASEFLGSVLPAVPSCLLLDVRLPGTNGLDFQTSLQQKGIHIPIILMTGYGDVQMSVRGMKAGAVDFLTKPVRHQDVLDAVSTALSRDFARRMEDREVNIVKQRYATLTPREAQVVALVTAGKMNKQMAATLQLSEVTVKIHRGSAMKKMGASSVADLVKMTEMLRTAGSRPRTDP
ncbi:response regulator transcription factor [Acidisoma sp. L85]|uniref:response regulator transcription factor n=1 Tax=Acidisoma sp. L85 TaxID=1641850 RepID=UPI00131ECA64|nr:response regulator [Acidisoma sp. L85]